MLIVAFSYNVRYGCMTIPYKTITKSGSLTCSRGEIEKVQMTEHIPTENLASEANVSHSKTPSTTR